MGELITDIKPHCYQPGWWEGYLRYTRVVGGYPLLIPGCGREINTVNPGVGERSTLLTRVYERLTRLLYPGV